MVFDLIFFLTAIIAGTVASITGFGIGSLITPLLSLVIDTKLAIAIVSIPHFTATAIRFWMLRAHLNKQILFGFGLMSALGGLIGATLHTYFATPALSLIFGIILIFSGLMGITNLSRNMKFYGVTAWIVGGISGILGGLVGNQGGMRSAALLGSTHVSKETFIATATAIGLMVDTARMPIYFWSESHAIGNNLNWIIIATIGVVIGTFFGTKLLKHVSEQIFRYVISSLIFLLGILMFYKGL